MKLRMLRLAGGVVSSLLVGSSRAAFQPHSHLAFTSSAARRRTAAIAMSAQPPSARREEDRVVIAGVDPSSKLARQSESSTEPLLNPGVGVPDPYGWMRDDKRENEEVLNHLKAENEYTEALTSHLGDLRETLYKEMLGSIQETDYTLPRPRGDYVYYTRSFEGKSYSVHCRAPRDAATAAADWDKSADSPIVPGEEVVLDVNKLAEGQKYCSTGAIKTSPSHKLLAYSVDFSGDETCQFWVKDLESGEVVDHDEKLDVYGSLVWGEDDTTLFYVTMDEAHRPYRVYKRIIGSDAEDELLFEEKDELYWLHISKSLDGNYLYIDTSSKETSEVHYLQLGDPESKLECVAKRRSKVLYEVEHRDGLWWIASNVDGTPNMRLMTAPAEPNCESEWKDVELDGNKLFDGGYDRSLSDITTFKTHVVCSGREGGIPRVWVVSLDGSEDVKSMEMLAFDEEAHDVGLSSHFEFDTDKIVVAYDSMITPLSYIEMSLDDTVSRSILKEKAVPGYDKSLYACERTTVKSRDGETDVPVSIVYRKDIMEAHKESGKPVPTHLYGYGSYGACMEASFSGTRLTLLNRGVVYVIAHIRGGGEMGRQWYEEPKGAKYLCKKNTFNDFVDIANWLIDDRKITEPSMLSCEGRSAGGLLIGASINQAPELFKAAILGVPFVDVVCTMIDASIPLTVVEFEEWGCPNEVKYHQYMMEYSPINNVVAKKYPSCLLTGGLHDPRVQVSFFPSKVCFVELIPFVLTPISVLGAIEVCCRA